MKTPFNKFQIKMGSYIITLIFTMASLGISTPSNAWIQTDEVQKEYLFKYQGRNQAFELRRSAASYEEAFESAAHECFRRYKNGRKLNSNEGQDIIDVCANPRS